MTDNVDEKSVLDVAGVEEPMAMDPAPSGDSKDEHDDAGDSAKSSKLDKLLQRLQGTGSEDHSRESSPDPASKDAGSSRQSRRKPKVTRKVVEDEDDTNADTASSAHEAADADMVDAAMDLAIQEFLNSADKDPADNLENDDKDQAKPEAEETKSKEKNTTEKESLDIDEEGNLILPEGTVVVQPEPVTDNKPVFKGPEFRSTSTTRKSTVQGEVDLSTVHCTSCNHQINTNHANSVKRHPVLKVILCKRCYNWYTSDEILQDQDGMDEQCRWCGEGGDLLCCDYCHNAFCKSCIRRNLGRGELSKLVQADEDSKWHCYVCDPKPLAELIHICDQVIEAIEKREDRRKEKEKKIEEKKKKQGPPAPSPRQQQAQQAKQAVFHGRQSGGKTQQQKPGTVYNLLNQKGVKQPIPQANANKGVAQKPQQPAKPQGTQGASQNVFAEWNFQVNESNVVPIIDRAMMVTESMHMLLSSLREDIQKAGNVNTSQRMVTKLDSANKLKRALSAFNKSYFDLSLFSQKTSGSTTTRKLMEEQQKMRQQQPTHKPGAVVQGRTPVPVKGRGLVQTQPQNKGVHPVQLVQHGKQVMMMPNQKQLAQLSQKAAAAAKQAAPKPKPASNKVEYIELLDSDDESKVKPTRESKKSKKEADSDEDDKALDERIKNKSFKLKVALGGPGHKLKGPLSKRRKYEEEQAKISQQSRDDKKEDSTKDGDDKSKPYQHVSDKKDGQVEELQVSGNPTETTKTPGSDVEEDLQPCSKEDGQDDAEAENRMDAEAEGEVNAEEDKKDAEDDRNEEESSDRSADQVMEVDSEKHTADESVEEKAADVELAAVHPNEEDPEDEPPQESDDLDEFKTIEEQLKQLNGGYTDDPFSKVDDLETSLIPQLDGQYDSDDDQMMQMDGTNDNRDTSSNESSPLSKKEESMNTSGQSGSRTYKDMFSSMSFEPLFNLDTLSDSGSDKNSSGEEQPDMVYDFGEVTNADLDGMAEDDPCEELPTDSQDALVDGNVAQESGTEAEVEQFESDPPSIESTHGNDQQDDGGKLDIARSREDIEAQRQLRSELLDDSDDNVPNEPNESNIPRSDPENKDDTGTEVPRSREDIEAQRQLHRELLLDDSDDNAEEEEEEEELATASEEQSEEEEVKCKSLKRKTYSDDDDYNPTSDSRQLKSDRKLQSSIGKGRGKGKGKRELRCIVRITRLKESSPECILKSDSKSDIANGHSSSEESTKDSTQCKHSKKDTNKKCGKPTEDNADSDCEFVTISKSAKKSSHKHKPDVEKSDQASSSENHDSDLEKDITNLAKMPKTRSKKSAKKVDSAETEVDGKKQTKEKPGSAGSSKKKSTTNLLEELSSGEEEDAEDDERDSDKAMETDDEVVVLNHESEDEDEQARNALLAIDSSEDSEDSDLDSLGKGTKKKTSKKAKEAEEEDYDSDDILPSKRRMRSALLDAKVSDSDESVKVKKTRKKRKKAADTTESEESDSETGKKKKGKGKKRRKRVKLDTDSSNADGESGSGSNEEDDGTGKKRKKIRRILNDQKLSSTTLTAAKAEEARRERVKERQKKYNEVVTNDENSPTKCPVTTKLVLESNEKTGEALIEVNPKIIKLLKPHQVEAVKFLWDCCAETVKQLQKEDGGGCILAHCMGLGKTLSVISFLSTIMAKPKITKMRTAMIICPLNTVLNWQSEFDKWLDEEDAFDVWEMSSIKDNYGRSEALRDWQRSGGIMIMGYEMYRNLSTHRNIKKKKQKETMTEALVDPGPDIVVCDEGHVLKNSASSLSKAVNQIRTRRRIVLTGTPLQNNLVEYHCMVDFVKPNLLGSKKEFTNRFVNPITNGQCSDSTARDVKLMKKRAHVLHETLAGCVQRRDYSALTKFLMPKLEYVVNVRLAPKQMELYDKYLERNLNAMMIDGRIHNKGARLFKDYQQLMKIWTHPWCLKLDEIRQENKRMLEDDSMSSFLDDDDSESEAKSTSSSDHLVDSDDDDAKSKSKPLRQTNGLRRNGRSDSDFQKTWKTRSRRGNISDSPVPSEDEQPEVVSRDWWGDYLTEEDRYKTEIGGKIMVLAEILKMCDSIGDKVLVFSQSLLSLDLIEDFLQNWDQDVKTGDPSNQIAGTGSWVAGLDYYRMDGSTSAQRRNVTTKSFNDPENTRMRLFLISTKAGSLGINLVSANRVIVFDASWNPTHDVQSIFRVYRFGQEKPVYVYRFLAQGTMEEKIYERQVTKQSLSQRVVDEHQIERHFSSADLQELYSFRPDRLDDPNREEKTLQLPKDRLLAELLTNLKDWISNYHEHDSLLENIEDETLTEEERKAAWEEYEEEKKGINRRIQYGNNMSALYQQQAAGSGTGLGGIVPEAEQIARAIYASNPGITQEALQHKVHTYLQARMEQQRMLMMQRQHEQQMQQELMKLQQLRLQRYRQQQYLSQMQQQGAGAPTGSSSNPGEFSALLQQLQSSATGSSSHSQQQSTTAAAAPTASPVAAAARPESPELEEGEVKLPSPGGLLNLLRRGIS